MSTSWKRLGEAEVLRYAYDSRACMRRLDDALEEIGRMRGQRQAIREVASVDVALFTEEEMTELLAEILSHTNNAAEAAGGEDAETLSKFD